MSTFSATPGQTIGPFFGYALPFDRDNELVPPGSLGAIRLHGIVTDGAGAPVPDALLEIWQADADGVVATATGSLRRGGRSFTGWGRACTDDEGYYSFTTVKPAAIEGDSTPFFAIAVFARGLLDGLFTRAYVAGEHFKHDRLLSMVPVDRRHTLIATPDALGQRFDIRLQGKDETVFLRFPGHAR
jgi:protocatechuate 3,4-dioxygenase alpha subunit